MNRLAGENRQLRWPPRPALTGPEAKAPQGSPTRAAVGFGLSTQLRQAGAGPASPLTREATLADESGAVLNLCYASLCVGFRACMATSDLLQLPLVL